MSSLQHKFGLEVELLYVVYAVWIVHELLSLDEENCQANVVEVLAHG